jgi:sec-independent protein translocase protein TatA
MRLSSWKGTIFIFTLSKEYPLHLPIFAPEILILFCMKPTLLFLGNVGGTEWLLIILVVLLLFGAKRIPELARGLGRGVREFKDASREIKREIEAESNEIKSDLRKLDQ